MKRLRLVMIVFALILTMSVVYAAASGSLTFTGTVSVNGIKLNFIEGSIRDSEGENSSKGSFDSVTGTTVTFSANLLGEDGEFIRFGFSLENETEFNIEIKSITITDGKMLVSDTGSGLNATYGDISIIASGITKGDIVARKTGSTSTAKSCFIQMACDKDISNEIALNLTLIIQYALAQ